MANVKKTKRKSTKPKIVTAQTQLTRTVQPAPPAAAVVPPASRTTPGILPSAWQQLQNTFSILGAHWKFFALLALLYALLNIVFVHSFASDVSTLKDELSTVLGGNTALTGLGTYALLITTTGNAAGAASAYQYVLLVVFSLACICALRQLSSQPTGTKLRVRDSLYDGMAPLVPFLLVLIVLSLELLPLAAAGSLLSVVLTNGIAVSVAERLVWIALFFAVAGVSVWLLTLSLFAPYIVTLPGGRPLQALKDAKRITKGRRLAVVRRLLFLLLVLLLVSGCLLVPAILLLAPLASIILFLLGAAVLPFVHAYLYGMYRELLA